MKVLVGLIAAVALGLALALAQNIFAPVAFALFIIAVVWPLQSRLERRISPMLATLSTLVITLVVVSALTYLIIWGLGRVGQWVFANASRFQDMYEQAGIWLEGHGFVLGAVVAEHVNVRSMLRVFQDITSRLQGLTSFLIFTFVYVLLGLLEVPTVQSQLQRLSRSTDKRAGLGAFLLAAIADIARKFQKYMVVRTLMSIATGFIVWLFTLAAGLELALAWGALAFALNYIPFIGPFMATLLPTLFALAQLGSWQMALFIFISLNVIQFLTGSYVEPRIAGAALSTSPFLVLFAVFFFAFLWGIAGAFIGVPILIAALTFCAHHPSSRFIADIFSGKMAREGKE